ncbi:hypothetical protein GCM10027418_22370 [Mariniluteicoccus endophyticus]
MNETNAWASVLLPGQVTPASYLVGPLAKQYRLIVDILQRQRDVTLTGVGFDTLQGLIRDELPENEAAGLLDELSLRSRMDQLVEWGTCSAWQDRAETQEDFLRNRHRYQLSEAGYQLNSAVHAIEAEMGATSTAVLLAPITLRDRLQATVAALGEGDQATASREFAQVQTTVQAMSEAATDWQNALAVALGGSPSEEKVTRLLETILTYAEMWGAGVDAWSGPIGAHLPRLREVPEAQWRAMALTRLGTSAADPLIDAAADEMRRDLDVLGAWFTGANPQATRLRRQIRDAVAPVLKSHRALLAVGGTVSRKADLLRLADALESVDTDEDAWRLWCRATGLHSARHVTDLAPEMSLGHRLSTWEADPVPIARRLRTQGLRSTAGRAPNIVDRRKARAEARRRAQREQANLERAATSLASRSGTPFSEWEPLDDDEAAVLLDLLTEARRYRPGTEVLEATSADGRWLLRLTACEGSAVLHVPTGRLVVPDAVVEFTA